MEGVNINETNNKQEFLKYRCGNNSTTDKKRYASLNEVYRLFIKSLQVNSILILMEIIFYY